MVKLGAHLMARVTASRMAAIALPLLFVMPVMASAQPSTKTYEYDALGRLVH